MPKNSSKSLPAELRFLQPFVRRLEKLPSDELDEMVDSSSLVKMLQKRIQGMDLRSARLQLDDDRRTLETWLKSSASKDHPAYWVLGYLSGRGLAKELLTPPVEPPPDLVIHFEPPVGYRRLKDPTGLSYKKGKLLASFGVIDELIFEHLPAQWNSISPSPEADLVIRTVEVQFGESKGTKVSMLCTAPPRGKSVNYAFAAPGGYEYLMLDAPDRDFDESEFEAQLHTLRVSESRA